MDRKILLFGVLFFGFIFLLVNDVFVDGSSDGPGPSHLPGWPVVINLQPYTDHIEHPVVGDLDNDGENEIIVSYYGGDDIVYVDAFKIDGTRLPGFPFSPLSVGGRLSIPAAADIDLDGGLDLVIAGGTSQDWKMYVFNYQEGQLVEKWSRVANDGSCQPDFHFAPSIGNIAGDEKLEIVYANGGCGTKLFAWHANGDVVSGWPVQSPSSEYSLSPPSLGDINSDGLLEVFSHYVSFFFSQNTHLFAWSGDGTLMPGWPVFIEEGIHSIASTQTGDVDPNVYGVEVVQASINGKVYIFSAQGNLIRVIESDLPDGEGTATSLADLDGDGDLEIIARFWIFGTRISKVYVWSYDGVLQNGWPQNVGGYQSGHSSSATVGNIAGSRQPEILVLVEEGIPSGSNTIYAFFANGESVPGWPYYTNQVAPGDNAHSSPIITDLNSDGVPEVVFSYFSFLSITGAVLDILTVPGEQDIEASFPWPTYQHDFQRTGFYPLPL